MDKRTEALQCPFCGHEAPLALFHWYATPDGAYARPFKCPKCKKIFAPVDNQTTQHQPGSTPAK